MLSKSVTELEKLSYLPREVRQHNPLSMQNIKKYFKANSFSDKKLVAEIRSRSPGSVLKKEKSLGNNKVYSAHPQNALEISGYSSSTG